MMQFLVAGFLKPNSEDRLLALSSEINEHLAQPYRKISLAGTLRGADGKRIGYLALIEAEDFAHAEAYLHESPLYQNELYERVQVAEFEAEVGYVE
jgi:uncharacterized protein YciI